LVALFPIALSALLALAAPASTAGTNSIAIRVEFDAPAGCSSVDAFYAGLLTRMSRARRAVAGEDAVHLSVRLTRLGTKVRGDLRLMDGPGDADTRRVEGESCESVVEVLSLTAALALTAQPPRVTPPPPPPTRTAPPPSRLSSGTAGASSSSSSASQAAEATPKPPEAPPPPPPEEEKPVIVNPPPPPVTSVRRTGVHLGLQAVAAGVITDAVNVGGGVAARLERHIDDGPGASIALAFIYAPNDLLQTPDQIAVHWTALAVTACPPWGLGRTFTLQACAQGIGGWLTATGVGVTNPSSIGHWWWSAGALLRAGAHVGGGFALELEGGATVPLVQRHFVTKSPDILVGETPTIAPFVVLGLSRSL
jgi:hypothetical protein